MKRILAALICVIMVCACFTACGKRADTDMGPMFDAYVGGEPFILDPQIDHTDDDAIQIMSLIFEGLTNINSKGKVENALLDKYTYKKDELKGEYTLTMTIKDTTWTDSRRVSADDFVYSWKRLLSPDFSSSAASLLYDVKNAMAAKRGDISIDDVGLAAVDTYTIEVIFEQDIEVSQFLRRCASIALVPLREDVINKSPLSWSKKSTSMVANGPFAVKGLNYEKGTMRLERNSYYFLDDDDDRLKYVVPYRIFVTFIKDEDASLGGKNKAPESLSAQLDSFINKQIMMLSDLPLDNRSQYAKQGTLVDSSSTLSVVINNNKTDYADARIRQALSAAIDRTEIANAIVYAKAASGLINYTCFDGSANKSFRDVGGSLISASKDISKATSLLGEAGASGLKITLTHRQTEEDIKVAEIIKANWEEAGVTVELEPVLATEYSEIDKTTGNPNTFYDDNLTTRYNKGEYEAILVDFNMISVDPFAALSQFSLEFSGSACDQENDWTLVGHACGFNDETYNGMIKDAFNVKNADARSTLLHNAEKYLLEQAPIIPIVFNQNFMMVQKEISGLKHDHTGLFDLRKVNLKNYLESPYYVTEEE